MDDFSHLKTKSQPSFGLGGGRLAEYNFNSPVALLRFHSSAFWNLEHSNNDNNKMQVTINARNWQVPHFLLECGENMHKYIRTKGWRTRARLADWQAALEIK